MRGEVVTERDRAWNEGGWACVAENVAMGRRWRSGRSSNNFPDRRLCLLYAGIKNNTRNVRDVWGAREESY